MVRQASRMPYTLTTCISSQRCQGLSCNQNRRAMPANVNGTCPVPQVASKARRKGCGTSYPCQHHYPRDHVYQITQNIENKSTSQLLNTMYSTIVLSLPRNVRVSRHLSHKIHSPTFVNTLRTSDSNHTLWPWPPRSACSTPEASAHLFCWTDTSGRTQTPTRELPQQTRLFPKFARATKSRELPYYRRACMLRCDAFICCASGRCLQWRQRT